MYLVLKTRYIDKVYTLFTKRYIPCLNKVYRSLFLRLHGHNARTYVQCIQYESSPELKGASQTRGPRGERNCRGVTT